MSTAIFRVEKLKSPVQIRRAYKHAFREYDVLNSDPAKRYLNVYEKIVSANDLIRKTNELKTRKDNVSALQLMLTYSPKNTDKQWLEKWIKKSINWVYETFKKENVAYICLHLDETTPHLDIMIMPILDGKLNAKHWTGGNKKLSSLQTSYYEAVKDLGLERGNLGSRQKHTRIKDFYKILNDPVTSTQLPPVNTLNILGWDIRMENAFDYRERVSNSEKFKKIRNQAAIAPLFLKEKKGFQEQIKAQQLVIEQKQKEVFMLKMKMDKVNKEKQELIDKLRDISLNEVMSRLGYEKDEDKKYGHSVAWKTGKGKIVITNDQKFWNFMTQKGGGGAIDLVMHLEDLDFKSTIAKLKSLFSEEEVEQAYKSYYDRNAKEYIKKIPPEEFNLPEKDPSKLEKVKEYLEDERGIDIDLINKLTRLGDLYANKYGSCVFVHRSIKDNMATGCTIRGTKTDFKQTLGKKSQGWFMVGQSFKEADYIVLVESPIDALSYLIINKSDLNDVCVLSLAGNTVPKELIEHLKDKKVVLALDNDNNNEAKKAVQMTYEQLESANLEVYREIPALKDWNAELCNARLGDIHN